MKWTFEEIIGFILLILPVSISFIIVIYHAIRKDSKDTTRYRGKIMSIGVAASLILMFAYIIYYILMA